MKSIVGVKNIKGKKVLLRLDLNVSLENGLVQDDSRIRKILPTIRFLREQKAKIIIVSHIGRNKTDSLRPVFDYMKMKMADVFTETSFVEDDIWGGEVEQAIARMNDSDILVLENIRRYEEEFKNDVSFSERLASLGDIYVNEAFSVSHRSHSSVVGLPKIIPSYSGILFEEEVKSLSKVFEAPKPFLLILGGNKLETKLPLIKRFLDIADYIYIGGAPANNFFKQKGWNVGQSLHSEKTFGLDELMDNEKVILPTDVTVKNLQGSFIKKTNKVLDEDNILDLGPESFEKIKDLIKESRFVLWNGPVGDYKNGFGKYTIEIAKEIAESEIYSVVGGGDTVASISELGLSDKFSFISTGGGAMLEFLVNKTLVGIEALNKKKK
ncbi:phosphoglycerate kinase [Patescibacteria group bacterium]